MLPYDPDVSSEVTTFLEAQGYEARVIDLNKEEN